ncbi:cation:proton antiporter domain-containing protein [Novosphingobium aerophilum]|uniref:Cation:proton antiporter n=1 Tax=Novosphingobium aerophilum TaxID=2839843 RepID=A0A7X1F651_9SPHN|nr:cation:proton antiporter [Novosphingobium aerophilum]MBC2651090.1 cation:proton antiporter [Novosphingobium aerophilum]
MAADLHTPALSDALVILGAAGLVIPVFARFRITPVIGFILVGLLVGPHGLGAQVDRYPWLYHVTITDPDGLAPFAEFGIILLLFSVGLELSFSRLWAMRREVFGVGAAELTGSAGLIAVGLMLQGNGWATALALGLALALSSTALVLRLTDARTPVGRAALSMLLFEDIALVPIIFLLGAIGGGDAAQPPEAILRTLGLGALVLVALLAVGRFLLPALFAQAARTRSPELFLSASLLVVIVASLATAAVGLSPIVGALLAGLLIAETEYHGEVETMTEPFKGLALGIFLITVGMQLDLALLWARGAEVLAALGLVFTAKAFVTAIMLRLSGARAGTSAEAGILLASPSETTLIVLTAAIAARLLSPEEAGFWQMVTALGLTVTPLLALVGRWLARRVERSGARPPAEPDEGPRAVVIGFGRVGRLVADMLAQHDQPYLAIDADADLIAEGQREGYAVAYGDAARGAMLGRLELDRATAVILTMNDPQGALRLVRRIRKDHPDLPIIARARDAGNAGQLYRAGATHAVPETLESSLQLSEAVLVDLGVPMGFVIASIHEKRDEFRSQIMEEGQLAAKPRLRTATLRDRGSG